MWIPSLLVCFFFFAKLFLKLDSVLSNGFIVTIAFVFFSVGFLGLSNRKTVAMLCTKWVSPVQGYGVCAINYSICNNADMCRWSINLRFAPDFFFCDRLTLCCVDVMCPLCFVSSDKFLFIAMWWVCLSRSSEETVCLPEK